MRAWRLVAPLAGVLVAAGAHAQTASIVTNTASVAVNEGASATYTVALATRPSAAVTVTVASDNTDVTADTSTMSGIQTTLNFSTINWSTAQTVTVAAAGDSGSADETATLTHTAAGGDYASVTASVFVAVQDDEQTGTDYDADEDGLIDIDSLDKLNAMRWDLDGNGAVAAGDATNYANAFPGAAAGMGCPDGSDADDNPDPCVGYELTRDLDFDTDDDGSSWADVAGTPTSDSDDAYHNGGSGWNPIGSRTARFAARFDGKGHLIENLFISRSQSDVALFAATASTAHITSIGLRNVRIHGAGDASAALVGHHEGWVGASWSSGAVQGLDSVGGLVGATFGNSAVVMTSYSIASVDVTGANGGAAGLVGWMDNGGGAWASYSAGAVTNNAPWSAGFMRGYGSCSGCYWDTDLSGIRDNTYELTPEGRSSAQLCTPVGYTNLYSSWDDVDVDGDGNQGLAADPDDDAWDFGDQGQWPVLKFGGHDVARQIALQPNVPLTFGTSTVSNITNARTGVNLSVQIPEATYCGTVTYTATGLPPGMALDIDGTGACSTPRTICGAPTRPGIFTVVVTAADGGASSTLSFQITVTPLTLSDPGLRRALEIALGKDPGATLTEGDLLTLSSLNLDGFGVASLAGLEAASNLEWLTLSGNAPEAGGEPLDLSPLAGLPSLTYLDLSDNALVGVSDLSRLTSLRTLLLGGNAIRDLSPLSGLTGLEALTLSGNGLADVSALSLLTSLEQLWLDGNGLADISALSALGALIYLHLGDNQIADISPLAGLSALRRLWLPGNMVADVSALAGLRALTRLDLSRNRIADASPLRGLTRLSWLRLGWNRLAGVPRLAGHPRLADGGALGLRGNPLGVAALATHIPALREAGAAVVFGWAVPLFPAASDSAGRSGVVRVLNRSDMDGMVLVEAVDEAGQMSGPATLTLAAGAAAQFDSSDLENGNAELGLAEGVGPPTRGSWRLLLWSILDIEVLAYVRTPDGFLTPAHAELPRTGDSLSAFLFNPASNRTQRSTLRVFNPGAESTRMSVWGVDDAGRGRFASGFMAPPSAPLVLRAGQLERSRGAAGSGLSNGAGKWRLRVHAPWPLSASTFLETPSGHLSNLSPPPLRAAAGEMLRLPLFPAASNPAGREGFARVANMTATDGMVDIEAVDDAGVRAGPVRLQLAARATMHFNSDDLENGNAKKGLASGIGAPTKGAWRLELQSSTLTLAAASYARHADGFVTSLHEAAPAADGAARVAVFHPASSDGPRSLLRLANNGDEPAQATITARDDAGGEAGPVSVTVPAGEALTLTAVQLEQGGDGLDGALGDGAGKWRFTVSFDNPLVVMSLMESPAGHLSNLSATTRP